MKSECTILFVILCLVVHSQEEVTVKYFKTSKDFNQGVYGKGNWVAEIEEQNGDYLYIKRFTDIDTRQSKKKMKDVWAIEVDSSIYFNLKFTDNDKLSGYFMKLDYIGEKFCYAHEGDTLSPSVKLGTKSGDLLTSALLFGLSGALLNGLDNAISNQHSKWLDKDGTERKILFINLTKENYEGGTYNSLRGIFINKKQIAKMSGKKYKKAKWLKLTFEEAIQIIKTKDKEN